jgi:hypothetical protein
MNRRRYSGPLTVGVTLLLIPTVTACGDGAAAIASTSGLVPGIPDSANGTRATRLLLSDGDPGASRTAHVQGRLGIDAQGCVTLGRYVVIAPRDSRLKVDGQTLVLTRLGEFHLGEEVSATGSLVQTGRSKTKISDEYRGCSSRNFAVLAAGTAPQAAEPDALDCASGYSSGSTADYFTDGGAPTAAEAIRIAKFGTHDERAAPTEQRLVENTVERVRVSYVDPAGTVIGATKVIKVAGKWQIEIMGKCAPVGSVAAGNGP